PLRDKMSPRLFRRVVLLFVLVAASQMIWKSGVFRHGGSHVTQMNSAHAGNNQQMAQSHRSRMRSESCEA
ncbi:sulfite exporter TauE/SafE family protein, partial [Geobacillus sp. LEMMJ02]